MNVNVLVVDDEVTVAHVVTRVLQRAGHDVVSVVDPLEAVTLLQDSPCDVLVTDRHMPVLSGEQLVRAARRLRPHLGIVMMTADPDESLLHELQLDALVSKPFSSLAHLVLATRNAFDAHHAARLEEAPGRQ